MDLFQATEMQGKDGDRMNKAFEKILDRLILESSSCKVYKLIKPNIEDVAEFNAYKKCIEIVKEVAEEYNCGWIPCGERLPEENQQVILQDFYGNITIEKMKIADGAKGFSDGDWWSSANNYVAWQPLPETFKERD